MQTSEKSAARLVWLLLACFGILRLWFWLTAFPNPDEAYYWLWGQHFDWSYYDHPPLLAWIQGSMSAVLGRSRFALRFPNLCTTLLFFYTQYRICRYLYGRQGKAAFWLMVMVVLASPLFFLFLALAWNDHLLISACLIAGYQFVRFLDSYVKDGHGESRRLYGAALALGVAGLAKYNALFIALAFVGVVIRDRRLWPLLRDRRLYGAIAIVLISLLPILIWNITNDYQSFEYYTSRSINSGATGLRIKPFEPIGFWLFSTLLLSPWLVELIVRLILNRRQPFPVDRTKTLYGRVAIWTFVLPTVGLSLIALFSTAYYYWNIMAYVMLFPLMPGLLLNGSAESMEGEALGAIAPLIYLRRRRWVWGQQIYGVLLISLIVVHTTVLPLSALVSNEATADPDSRMPFGWVTVAPVVLVQQAQLPRGGFLATTDYRSASALAYQLNEPNVYALSDRRDQFDVWMGQTDLSNQDAVLVYDDWHPLTPALSAQFKRISDPEVVVVERFGITIKNYYVATAYGFAGSE
ncbi:MAG: glycosyltransferase family 39 protein [Cyanobacteria bacterium J06639_16]